MRQRIKIRAVRQRISHALDAAAGGDRSARSPPHRSMLLPHRQEFLGSHKPLIGVLLHCCPVKWGQIILKKF
jgi:hypothetical protein